MKKGMFIFLIMSIMATCAACNGNSVNKDVYQNTRDVFLDELYPDKEGFYWYYEAPNDEERIMYMEKIQEDQGNKIITMRIKTNDLSGTLSLEELTSYETIIIGNDYVKIDEKIVLKLPLEVGNSWETEYLLDGEQHKATVTITEITDNQISTRTEILNLDEYADKKFIQDVTYEKGLGIIHTNRNYDFERYENFSRGFRLVSYEEQLENPELWYLAPYEREKSVE